jgi:hypothetical protein
MRAKNAISPISSKREEALDSILDKVCSASGTKYAEVGDAIVCQVGQCLVERGSADAAERLSRAVNSLEEMKPANLTEAMLAGQMLTANTAAQRFLAFALVDGQTAEGADRNVTRAVRLMRIFIEQIDAMQRLKGRTGQQRVVVEHVNVQEGGQAIVGAVMGARPDGENSLRKGSPHG